MAGMDALPASRLLVVDPDRARATRLVELLLRAGHAAEACGNLDEAIAAARRAPVDLALVDPDACDGEEPGRAGLLGEVAFLAEASAPAQCLPAIHAALSLALARAAGRIAADAPATVPGLALAENRAIGFAVGLLMERLRVDRKQAFEALRSEARARRQRISDVAESLLGAAELLNGLRETEACAAHLLAS